MGMRHLILGAVLIPLLSAGSTATALAGDKIVNFGSAVPTLDQLHSALGGGQQRAIEFGTPAGGGGAPSAARQGASQNAIVPSRAPAQGTATQSASAGPVRPSGRRISMAIQFELDSAEVKPEFYSHLDQLARFLSEEPDARLKIVGHTDAHGSERHNWALSVERAERVRRILVSDLGVAPGRLSAEGYGESQSLYSDRYDGRNRRVEFERVD